MTPEPKLTRWTAEDPDVPGELRDLLRVNRDQLGTQRELLELKQSLSQALGPEAGLAGASATIKAPLAAIRWGAWMAGGIVSGVAIWSITRGTPDPSSASPPHRAAVESPAAQALDEAPPLTTPSPPAEPAVDPGPEPAPAVAEPPAAGQAAAQPQRRSKAAASGLPEAELLRKAQALLSEDPSRALALTREHEQRFQRGALAQEREVIAIEALKRLGLARAASDRAAEFEKRYRGSVHQSRVRGPAAEH
jgi:hypothetical protein